ncbi:MAG: hypothetical protein HDT46_05380 [Ruminococcaceae bacterium]|nr:hypothetical protein [Oscillospiraceae bacterium]
MKNFETFAGVSTQPPTLPDTNLSIVDEETSASKFSQLDKKAVKKIVKKELKKEKKKALKRDVEKSLNNSAPQSIHENEPAKNIFGSFFRKLGDAIIKALPAVLVTVAGIVAKSFFGSLRKMKGEAA